MQAAAAPAITTLVETWFTKSRPSWRRTNVAAIRSVLDSRILPYVTGKTVAELDRSGALAFPLNLYERKGRGGEPISPKSANEVMGVLRMITNDASDRFALPAPYRGRKPLKERRPDVAPFTFAALQLILEKVRPDFRSILAIVGFELGGRGF